jgi:hypothetical protein
MCIFEFPSGANRTKKLLCFIGAACVLSRMKAAFEIISCCRSATGRLFGLLG